jgi:hypothetical protein
MQWQRWPRGIECLMEHSDSNMPIGWCAVQGAQELDSALWGSTTMHSSSQHSASSILKPCLFDPSVCVTWIGKKIKLGEYKKLGKGELSS